MADDDTLDPDPIQTLFEKLDAGNIDDAVLHQVGNLSVEQRDELAQRMLKRYPPKSSD